MLLKVSVPEKIQFMMVTKFSNEIHYIGGAEVLPAPLESDEEARMIAQLGGDNDEGARRSLVERNLRLVVYIAKKFDNTGVGVEDLISIGTIGLI